MLVLVNVLLVFGVLQDIIAASAPFQQNHKPSFAVDYLLNYDSYGVLGTIDNSPFLWMSESSEPSASNSEPSASHNRDESYFTFIAGKDSNSSNSESISIPESEPRGNLHEPDVKKAKIAALPHVRIKSQLKILKDGIPTNCSSELNLIRRIVYCLAIVHSINLPTNSVQNFHSQIVHVFNATKPLLCVRYNLGDPEKVTFEQHIQHLKTYMTENQQTLTVISDYDAFNYIKGNYRNEVEVFTFTY